MPPVSASPSASSPSSSSHPHPQPTNPTHLIKPQYDSDDSDSDSDSVESITDVSLGLPDGPLDLADESNPLVSRIGGKVAWLPIQNPPPKDISICSQCGKQMEMLVEIFAPLVDSAFDRCLIVWACSRAVCQRKENGSIRAIRVLQHNPRWAAKLKKQKEKREQRELSRKKKLEEQRRLEEEKKSKTNSGNPFSMNGSTSSGSGLGSSLFGGSSGTTTSTTTTGSNPFASPPQKEQPDNLIDNDEVPEEEDEEEEEEEDEESSRLEEEEKIKEKLNSTNWSSTSHWSLTSSHYSPSLYLNTIPEPSKALRLSEKSNDYQSELMKKVEDLNLHDKKSGGGGEKERYESTQIPGLDLVFEKFVKRVGCEGRQVVRYEFNGLPLPFSNKGHLFNLLWPKKSQNGRVEIGRNHSNEPMELRNYDDQKVPRCLKCGGKRVFECQLMPNLVNLLKVENIKGSDDESEKDEEGDGKKSNPQSQAERRRKEIERALGRNLPNKPVFGEDGISRSVPQDQNQDQNQLPPRTGLTWSTALVYVCENDCSEGDESESESWREEWVGLMWED